MVVFPPSFLGIYAASKRFDYIHVRFIAGWIEDWPRFMQQAYAALKPGGYIELHDQYDYYHSDDGSISADSALRRWIGLIDEAICKSRKLEWVAAVKRQDEFLRDAGFDSINKRVYQLPVGPWPKEDRMKALGLCVRQHEFDSCEGFSLAPLTRVMGWTTDQVNSLIDDVKRDLMDRRIHSFIRSSLAYGRKPLREPSVQTPVGPVQTFVDQRSLEQPVEWPAEQRGDWLMEQTAELPLERPVERSAERRRERKRGTSTDI